MKTYTYRHFLRGHVVQVHYDRHERAWCAYVVTRETVQFLNATGAARLVPVESYVQAAESALDVDKQSAIRQAVVNYERETASTGI